jgi:tetratricopeptide (TPR) repeat protein
MNGRTINDRYKIESQIGQGGMGTVYHAHDSVLDREVAIKFVSGSRLGTDGRSRLLAEAQTVAKLRHPNIVTVFDAGEIADQPFVVMEFIEGSTLNNFDVDGLTTAVDISMQICTALQYAHESGIVHRDLKPENVMIEPGNNVRLMDFGLAVSTSSRMTEMGLIVGTVSYMSPEQAFGRDVSPQSDLYSLGVILYELTTGGLPFEAEDALAVITQHIHAPVVPPQAKNEQIPVALNDLILSLMRKEPGDRPGSAAEVKAVLADPQLLAEGDMSAPKLSVLDRIVRGRIVGRQAEFEEARGQWRMATSGNGHALLISGEPGIGKTRLTKEIVTHVEVSGGNALIGECYAENNAPYSAFSQIVRQALSDQPEGDIVLTDAVLDDLLSLTPDLRLQHPEITSNPKLDPESEQQRLFEHMVAFCKALAMEKSLLIVVDDAHWGDSGTLAMLHHLIRRTQNLPVMILVTYREIELRESRPFNDLLLELNRQRLGTRLKLERLDRESTRQMLKAIFAEEISNEFLDGIYQETEGNPFFIEEVCRALVESGALYYADGEWHRPSMEELEIPQGVQIAVESRLTKLPEDHQEILRMAAILGREFNYEILLTAVEINEDTLIDALEAAESAQMIQEVNGTGEVTFVFVHALVPSAIAESIRTLRRRRMHKKAAAAIEQMTPHDYEALAYHFSESGDEERALKYLIAAGERAASVYANLDAEEHFLAALDLVEDDKQKADLSARLGISQANQGKFSTAIKTWQKTIELYQRLGDLDKVAEIYARAGRAIWDDGDTKGELEICLEGLTAVEGAPEGPGFVRLLAETGRAYYFNGMPEESAVYCRKALDLAEKHKLIQIQIECLITLGMLPAQSKDGSIDLLEKAIELAETNNFPRQADRAHNNLGVQYTVELVDYAKAANHYQRAADLANQVGNREMELFSLVNLAFNNLNLGQLKNVEQTIPVLEELMEALPEPGAGSRNLTSLRSGLLTYQGKFDQALELLYLRVKAHKEVGDLQTLFGAYLFMSWIALIKKDFELGKSVSEEITNLGDLGIGFASTGYALLSRVNSQMGEIEKAIQNLSEAQKLAGERTRYLEQLFILWAQAELFVAQRKWEQAWKKYSELIELTTQKRFRWHRAWANVDWADALLTHSEVEDWQRAQELLEEALSEYQDMGADGFVELLAGKLAVIG